ncbi:cation diffusion facilitator family transporter [Slackia heliotrinireducens]|uniref:cation diffusion facilitator family transporter n=1 Tax=Slackia heliotrinireducens TaxID=84110 RepID=UPI00331619C4
MPQPVTSSDSGHHIQTPTDDALPDVKQPQITSFLDDDDDDEELNWIHGDLDEDDDDIDDNVNDTSSIAFKRRQELLNQEEPSIGVKLRSNLTVVAAVVAGITVACVKFIASAITGSVAMMSEGVHSLVDASNDALLLIGTKKSQRKPDVEHPFGYGRELYFWTFVVSVVIFFFGGGFTLFQGVKSFMAGGNVVENPLINYIVLIIGIVLEGTSLTIALKDVNNARGERSIWEYIRNSKSPTNFTVLLEDSAAVGGMIIALIGIALSLLLKMPRLDSVASIVIGLTMATVAVILLRETRSLLIGEGLTMDEVDDVVFIVEEDPAVIKCGRVLSMYMSPHDMLLNLDVTFDDELDEGDVLQAIDRIEAELIDEYPQCTSIFIEVESLNQVYRQRRDRREAFEEAEEDDDEPRIPGPRFPKARFARTRG